MTSVLRDEKRQANTVPVRSGVRTPGRQAFEIDRKLDILGIGLVYTMAEEGVIRSLSLHLASFSVIDSFCLTLACWKPNS
jgi:hypothetical protein